MKSRTGDWQRAQSQTLVSFVASKTEMKIFFIYHNILTLQNIGSYVHSKSDTKVYKSKSNYKTWTNNL